MWSDAQCLPRMWIRRCRMRDGRYGQGGERSCMPDAGAGDTCSASGAGIGSCSWYSASKVNVYGVENSQPLGRPGCAGRAFIASDRALVSALRVSIPDAGTLARAGDCKLPTPLRKTPWRRAPVLLWAWITCSLRNRRHAAGDTAHEAKAGCHRHGCAVAMAPLNGALHAARFAGMDWKPFAVLAHSIANIVPAHPCADCRAAGEKRTSHAKPPTADAQDRGSARLRLRAGRTTPALLSWPCSPV